MKELKANGVYRNRDGSLLLYVDKVRYNWQEETSSPKGYKFIDLDTQTSIVRGEANILRLTLVPMETLGNLDLAKRYTAMNVKFNIVPLGEIDATATK